MKKSVVPKSRSSSSKPSVTRTPAAFKPVTSEEYYARETAAQIIGLCASLHEDSPVGVPVFRRNDGAPNTAFFTLRELGTVSDLRALASFVLKRKSQ